MLHRLEIVGLLRRLQSTGDAMVGKCEPSDGLNRPTRRPLNQGDLRIHRFVWALQANQTHITINQLYPGARGKNAHGADEFIDEVGVEAPPPVII